jgi:hypothetical protein
MCRLNAVSGDEVADFFERVCSAAYPEDAYSGSHVEGCQRVGPTSSKAGWTVVAFASPVMMETVLQT